MKRCFTFGLFATLLLPSCVDPADESLPDVNVSGGVATEGEGNPWDRENPGAFEAFDPAKADGPIYEIPSYLPKLIAPHIIVSLEGLSIELRDEASGFEKVYPTGVGARGSSGKSYTPVGEFNIGDDPSNGWWFYKRRYRPTYFGGWPFLRLTAVNSRNQNTYGLHGPITAELIRGFVSHGCMRMQPDDLLELFYIVINHPGAPVTIQEAVRVRDDGSVVDVTPPEWDQVATYRARMEACEEDELEDGATLEPGLHAGLGLCDLTDQFTTHVPAGHRLSVRVRSGAPFELTLVVDEDATEAETSETDAGREARAELDVAADTAVTIELGGALAAGAYDLEIQAVPFEQLEPTTPDDDDDE
jgi:lipoprotein-anchoring transpeptidase ErfK/SrfK